MDQAWCFHLRKMTRNVFHKINVTLHSKNMGHVKIVSVYTGLHGLKGPMVCLVGALARDNILETICVKHLGHHIRMGHSNFISISLFKSTRLCLVESYVIQGLRVPGIIIKHNSWLGAFLCRPLPVGTPQYFNNKWATSKENRSFTSLWLSNQETVWLTPAQPSLLFDDTKIIFYSWSHTKSRLGWVWCGNDKELKTCFSLMQLNSR